MLVDWWDDDRAWGHDRLREVFNMVGAGPDFEARGRNAVLAPLTSPVQYLSSLPADPFQSDPEMKNHPYYYYWDNDPMDPDEDHDFAVFKKATADQYGTMWLKEGDWFLGAIGPDKSWYSNPSGRDVREVRGLIYDASNGASSKGDIILSNRGIR